MGVAVHSVLCVYIYMSPSHPAVVIRLASSACAGYNAKTDTG